MALYSEYKDCLELYFCDRRMQPRKSRPATVEWELRAKNLLKGELKRKGVTYADLSIRLKALGLHETERNLSNKINRGGFTAAFLLQCLCAVGVEQVRLGD